MRRIAGLIFGLLVTATAFAQPRIMIGEMLQAHNSIRRNLGLPPLAWSDRLAARAQEWAQSLMAKGEFRHNPRTPYGENLFEITGAQAQPAEVVRAWALEASDYDHRSNRCTGTSGHYTQIVWRDTKEVGCAATGGIKREIWVCEYDPPGNVIGQRPY
jgi:pathogenesis-related protein 1